MRHKHPQKVVQSKWDCTKKTILINYANKQNVDLNYYDDIEINNETKTTFLGYEIDHKISHNHHIDKVCKRIARGNYAIIKLKPLICKKTLKMVYYAHVHAIINYALTVWGNGVQIQRVLKLQKKSIRIMNNLYRRESAREYFRKEGIMTVISLYIFNSLMDIHREKDLLKQRKDIHSYNTRNKDKLCVPKTRTKRYLKQGIPIKIKLYNLLPTNITCLPMKFFKKKLTDFLKDNPFYSINEYMDLLTEAKNIF